jgi:hypothetical protein
MENESRSFSKYEKLFMNAKSLHAFKGKKCQCYICNHGQCVGDVTHFTESGLYLCWHCADVFWGRGEKVYEFVF